MQSLYGPASTCGVSAEGRQEPRDMLPHLLNLLAAVALLIWGTHLVRTGILRVFGANLRQLIARSVSTRFTAVLSGMGVTALVQSSTATAPT
eukprot:gene29657-36736_t